MYFINRGTVEVISEHDEPIIFDTMGEGRFFGEVSPRPASIRFEPKDLKVYFKNSLIIHEPNSLSKHR